MKPSILVLAAFATPALAQTSVSVDFTGASISSLSTAPADLVRTSTGTINASPGYTFAFNPVVRGTGLLGAAIIPNDTPLGDVLNGFVPGQQRILFGAVRNPASPVPTTINREVLDGVFSGFSLQLTFEQMVLADRRGQSAIRNIHKPFGLGLNFISGGAVYATFTPPPAQITEFHFDGDLNSVRQAGDYPASGPGRMRYLDDPAFGPILGGPGAETTYPSPPTPTDVTRAQSAFGTTASFGLPSIGGEDDTVYRTSPTRNLADASNRTKSRGLGLALWTNTHDYWPDDRNGQWTFVWDILIPTAAWNTEYPVALIEDNHNNDSSADSFIRIVNNQATFGYQVPVANYVTLPGVQPNQWFRLALSSDGYRTKTGRVFVNGTFVGTTGGDWVYSSTKSTDPRWGDLASTNPTGTPVAPATWNGWGQFPSPWALSPNAAAAPMASTICLFADLQGRGESVYIANLMYTDEAMTDAQIASLGGPHARGIVYLRPAPPTCDPDLNQDGNVDQDDVAYLINVIGGGANPSGRDPDFTGDGNADQDDVTALINTVGGGGCP